MVMMVVCINVTGVIPLFQRKLEERETKSKEEEKEENVASGGKTEQRQAKRRTFLSD